MPKPNGQRALHTLTYGTADGVATIRLHRPAIDLALVEDLYEAVFRAAADPGARAVLLCSAGPSLSTGGDLAMFARLPRAELPGRLRPMIDRYHLALKPDQHLCSGGVRGPGCGGWRWPGPGARGRRRGRGRGRQVRPRVRRARAGLRRGQQLVPAPRGRPAPGPAAPAAEPGADRPRGAGVGPGYGGAARRGRRRPRPGARAAAGRRADGGVRPDEAAAPGLVDH